MGMRSIASAVEIAVGGALAGTPWERDPTMRAGDDEDSGVWPPQEVRLVWCGSFDAVRRRYPHLPQSQGNDPGGCVDLWVHIDAAGLLSDVDFEGLTLSETFRRVQRPAEAEQVDRLLGLPADVGAPRLARHLVEVLRARPTSDA